jgi:sugar phosphate isomerase/epimerase
MSKKKISIGGWAFIWGGYEDKPIPLVDVVKRLQELKFDGIEMAAFPPHMDPAEYDTQAKRKEIKKLLDDHGLEVSGLAANFNAVPPATAKPTDYIEVVKTNLDICHDLDIPKLRVDTISPPAPIEGQDYDTSFWRVAHAWNRAAEYCDKEGIQLIWEFEPGFLFNKPSEIVNMVYAVDHPNFTTLFDSCHAHMVAVVGARHMGEKEILPGGISQFAHMLTGKIGHVHFIDSDGTLHGDETSTHAPFGMGVLDFDSFVKDIEEAGYTDDWWPIDLCFWPNAMDVTADCKVFMDKLVEKYS